MAKRHYLRFLIRNMDDLIFEISQEDSQRLEILLNNLYASTSQLFCSETPDGKTVVVNLSYVQAVRYLWERSESSPKKGREANNIKICLRNRPEIIESSTTNLEALYDFFSNLQYGPEVVAYPSFFDEDGELFQFNAREICWALAPTFLIEEGAEQAAINDGLVDK